MKIREIKRLDGCVIGCAHSVLLPVGNRRQNCSICVVPEAPIRAGK